MKVPSALKSVKYNLTVVNGIFVLTGIVLLIVGVLVLERNSRYEDLITYRFFALPGLAVGTGVFIIFLSVLGSFAAISEKFYFILAYVVLLLIVLVLEVAITISAFKLDREAVSRIKNPMEASIKYYEQKRDVAKTWDTMQKQFHCCGVGGVNSWHRNRIPLSCCFIDYGTTEFFSCTAELAYAEGCASVLGTWLGHNAHVLAVTAFVLTCIQAVLVGIAGWLAWRAKSKY